MDHLYLTGYTPHPPYAGDKRLPHIAVKLGRQISKTALGAEQLVPFTYSENAQDAIKDLALAGYDIVGLEQTSTSIPLTSFKAPEKCALVLGEEVEGISTEIQALCEAFVEIPMKGRKESFNVSVAVGIALYELTQANN